MMELSMLNASADPLKSSEVAELSMDNFGKNEALFIPINKSVIKAQKVPRTLASSQISIQVIWRPMQHMLLLLRVRAHAKKKDAGRSNNSHS